MVFFFYVVPSDILQSFLASALFDRRKPAVLFGYSSVIVVLLLCPLLLDNILMNFSETDPVARLHLEILVELTLFRFCLSLFPPWALYRALLYIGAEVVYEGNGMKMNQIGNPGCSILILLWLIVLSDLNVGEVYIFLTVQWAVMMVMWAYLEQVLPSQVISNFCFFNWLISVGTEETSSFLLGIQLQTTNSTFGHNRVAGFRLHKYLVADNSLVETICNRTRAGSGQQHCRQTVVQNVPCCKWSWTEGLLKQHLFSSAERKLSGHIRIKWCWKGQCLKCHSVLKAFCRRHWSA